MKKTLLALATVTVLSSALIASPAIAAKKVLLKVPVYFGTHLTGLGSTPKWLAENVNVASNGSVKIKIYEPGKLIPPKEILQAVHKGQSAIGLVCLI